MSIWFQTIIVLLIVAAAAGVVGWQMLTALVGQRSRFGACCAKGCPRSKPAAPPKARIAFVPAELLIRGK